MTDLKTAKEAAELTVHILERLSLYGDDSVAIDDDNLQSIENFYGEHGELDNKSLQTLVNSIIRESFARRYAQEGETIVITPDNAKKIEDVYGTDINKAQAVNNLIAKGWRGK